MADPTTQAQPVYLRDIRVLRRGPDDIVTGATVVETGAACQRSDWLTLSSPATGVEHVRARLRPSRDTQGTVHASLGKAALPLVVDEGRDLPPGQQAAAICVMRRPRWFGRASVAFVLAGADRPLQTMARALGMVGAVWPRGIHWITCLVMLAVIVIAATRLSGAIEALQQAGFVSAITAVQFALIGIAAGFVLRHIVRPLAIAAGALATALTIFALLAASHAGRDAVVARYEPFAPLLDPAGYVLETVGEPTEAMIVSLREELVPRKRVSDDGSVTYLCNFWEIGCREKAALVAAFDSRITIERPTLCDGFVDKLGGPSREDQCAAYKQRLNADLLWSCFAIVFCLYCLFRLMALRRKTITDLSIMIWAGGAPLAISPSND